MLSIFALRLNVLFFSKEIIVICLDNVRNSGGFSVEIIEVIKEASTTLIKVKFKSPKPMDMLNSVIIQPYHIVKINKTNKKIKFLEL